MPDSIEKFPVKGSYFIFFEFEVLGKTKLFHVDKFRFRLIVVELFDEYLKAGTVVVMNGFEGMVLFVI